MTYTITRDGRNLGTYSDEGLERQLNNGDILPTDLAFLEKENRWVPISELPKGDTAEVAQFTQSLEVATPNAFVTLILIALNVVVFIAMVIGGVSPMEPTNAALVHWGADLGALTMNGQWWRLLTSAFVHVGIIHLAFNMWALLSGGIFTERLFGNAAFLTLYILSAIGGNLASIAYQPFTVAAGASGAIFGVYGALIGLLIVQHRSIPAVAAASLGKNALMFVGYNIIYGLTDSHIDMAAHLGGLFTGLVSGCALAYGMNINSGSARSQRSRIVAVTGLLLAVPIAWKIHSGDPQREQAYATELTGTRLAFDTNDFVVYSGTAADKDAKRLGQTLRTLGFMGGTGALVLYSQSPTDAVVSLIVREGAWEDPKLRVVFDLIGGVISTGMSTPMKLRLLNKERETKKEFSYNHSVSAPLPARGSNQ